MKFNTKTKKILAIGIISLIVVVVFVYFMNRSQVAKAEETITGAGTTSSPAGSTGIDYSKPASERYAGMSKEAIIQDYIEHDIKSYSVWFNDVKEKAIREGRTLNEQLRLDAIYMLKGANVPGF